MYCRRSEVLEHVLEYLQVLTAAPALGYRLQLRDKSYGCCGQPGCGAAFTMDNTYRWLLPDGTQECNSCSHRKLVLLAGKPDIREFESGYKGRLFEAVSSVNVKDGARIKRMIRQTKLSTTSELVVRSLEEGLAID